MVPEFLSLISAFICITVRPCYDAVCTFLLLSGKFKKNMIEYTLFSSSEAEICNAKNDIVINWVGINKRGTKSKQYFLLTPSEVGKNV